MRIVFAGRDNAFDRGLINWLERHFDVVFVYFLEPDRRTPSGRWRTIRARWRRHGLRRTLDELAFHAFDRLVLRRREGAAWREQVDADFLDPRPIAAPHASVDDPHEERWLRHLAELDPDIVLAVCGSVIFKPEFFDRPKLGTFVLHEGITPEYRGLHNPLWALLRGDLDLVGVSLLRIDATVDGGAILFQRRYELEPGDDLARWALVGHKAILRHLDGIREALLGLERRGGFEPVSQQGRRSGYYSWMRLTTYLKLLWSHRGERSRARDSSRSEHGNGRPTTGTR